MSKTGYVTISTSKDQQPWTLFEGAIWRTVSKEALPASITQTRNFLLPFSVLMLGADVLSCFIYRDQWMVYLNNQAVAADPTVPVYTSIFGQPAWDPLFTGARFPDQGLMFRGGELTWLALCFMGTLSMVFGSLWLEKRLLMLATALYFCILPPYTAINTYLAYAPGAVFVVWWYGALCIWQLVLGTASLYLYGSVQLELNERERQSDIRPELGMTTFDPKVVISAAPCGHELRNQDLTAVVDRLNQPYMNEIRSNVLCPVCKERVVYLTE